MEDVFDVINVNREYPAAISNYTLSEAALAVPQTRRSINTILFAKNNENATLLVTVNGTSASDGVIEVVVGGQSYPVNVLVTDTKQNIASKIAAVSYNGWTASLQTDGISILFVKSAKGIGEIFIVQKTIQTLEVALLTFSGVGLSNGNITISVNNISLNVAVTIGETASSVVAKVIDAIVKALTLRVGVEQIAGNQIKLTNHSTPSDGSNVQIIVTGNAISYTVDRIQEFNNKITNINITVQTVINGDTATRTKIFQYINTTSLDNTSFSNYSNWVQIQTSFDADNLSKEFYQYISNMSTYQLVPVSKRNTGALRIRLDRTSSPVLEQFIGKSASQWTDNNYLQYNRISGI